MSHRVDYSVTLDEVYDRSGWCRAKLLDHGEWRYCSNRSDGSALFCKAHGGRLASDRAVVTNTQD